jgi:5'-3' exonuclease
MKKLLIDADSLVYQNSKNTIKESIDKLDDSIKQLFRNTDASEYKMFLTIGKNFRYSIYPEYKANRAKYKSPLKFIQTLKYYLVEEYGAYYFTEYEADDLVAFFRKEYANNDSIIVCSTDKDVLESCVGSVYDYRTNEFYISTEKKAEEFLYYQLLAGDTSDNIKGLHDISKEKRQKMNLPSRSGVGEKTALDVLKYCINNNLTFKEVVTELYKDYYKEKWAEYFELNKRLVKLGNEPDINIKLALLEMPFISIVNITDDRKEEDAL